MLLAGVMDVLECAIIMRSQRAISNGFVKDLVLADKPKSGVVIFGAAFAA